MIALWNDVASEKGGELGLPTVLAIVVAALIVCWLVLRLVLREAVRFSTRLGPARRDVQALREAPAPTDARGTDTDDAGR